VSDVWVGVEPSEWLVFVLRVLFSALTTGTGRVSMGDSKRIHG